MPSGVRVVMSVLPGKDHTKLSEPSTTSVPQWRVTVDVLGPLPVSEQGNKYLPIVTDYFTKWTEAFLISDQEVAEILVKEEVSR